jgi:cytochrome c553
MACNRALVITFLLLPAFLPIPVIAEGDASAGKAKSITCAGCHGPEGVSTNPMWPSLAGQKEQYLVKQLRDFRDGRRHNPVMAPMAKVLSDQDIENLAAYYSSLDP